MHYQGIHWRWPEGALLAVCLDFNTEHFAFVEGLGAAIGPGSPRPNVLNDSWRKDGKRFRAGVPL